MSPRVSAPRVTQLDASTPHRNINVRPGRELCTIRYDDDRYEDNEEESLMLVSFRGSIFSIVTRAHVPRQSTLVVVTRAHVPRQVRGDV
jgi:hypothetical protein